MKRTIIAACAALVITGACTQATQADKSFDAEHACNEFVTRQLKSPSTAHFPSDTSSHVDTAWTVSGAVDSQNGFGAELRSRFTCTMTDTGTQWRLDNLDFVDGGT